MRPTMLLAAACGLGLASAATADSSIQCDRGIVQVGDAKIDLLGKCGPPALQETRFEERAVPSTDVAWSPETGAYLPAQRHLAVAVETWTYDVGPQRFIQIVTLEAGRIVSIERGGYGYVVPPRASEVPVPRARCQPEAIRAGDTTFDVLTRCGEPASRDAYPEPFAREVWTYDFGPQAFVRFVHLENGKVARVETGSYGYAR